MKLGLLGPEKLARLAQSQQQSKSLLVKLGLLGSKSKVLQQNPNSQSLHTESIEPGVRLGSGNKIASVLWLKSIEAGTRAADNV